MTRAPLTVALFGEFGTENLGNDGSLAVTLEELRRRLPDATFHVVCVHPEPVAARFGVRATSVSGPRLKERGARRPGTLLNRVGSKLVDPLWVAWTLRTCDAVVLPGTGILEDSDSLKPWSTPWMVAGAAAGARFHRLPLAYVGVGVSPAVTRVKRRLFRFALRSATFRTYRDDYSRDAAHAMGVDTTGDAVQPDVCFVLDPPPAHLSSGAARVGLGVMDWNGESSDPGQQERDRVAYEDAMTTIALQTAERGHDITLLIGESRDARVADLVRDRVTDKLPEARVRVQLAGTLEDLLEEMRGLDAVVATRFHNVVCALRSAVPTVALSYAPKTRALMRAVGREQDCLDVDALDPQAVLTRLESVLADREAARAATGAAVADYPRTVALHLDRLVEHLVESGAARRRRGRRLART
ncbi:polysaccharide pyruvyl transferase family protein [Mumia sp. DW29H23]|uniref:polysaccharide pyruvyl transferase family protein n=1 Tax=Mumia sp. DW29H23 TaxID=3421241 RepID=UPI003D6847D0